MIEYNIPVNPGRMPDALQVVARALELQVRRGVASRHPFGPDLIYVKVDSEHPPLSFEDYLLHVVGIIELRRCRSSKVLTQRTRSVEVLVQEVYDTLTAERAKALNPDHFARPR